MIYIFFISITLLIGLVYLQFRNQRLNHKIIPNEIVAIRTPQIETLKNYKKSHPSKIKEKKWDLTLNKEIEFVSVIHKPTLMIHKKYIFYGINGLKYYQKELSHMQNILIQELNKPTTANLESISELTDAQILEQIINPQKIIQIQKEIDLLKQRNSHFQEPLDSCWITLLQNPFNKWQSKALNNIDIFSQSQIIQDNNNILNQNITITLDKTNNIVIIDYNGPQKLLIRDKENFLGNLEFIIPNGLGEQKARFNLYFNPIRKNLSIYKKI